MTNWTAGPTVSVVTTCYNKALYIAQTLESVLAQTYPNVELIAVDDGSTDESLIVIERCLEGSRARIVELTNGGVSRARNVGFSSIRDEPDYVLFLDGDDLLEPHAIDYLVSYMEANPNVGMTYTVSTLIDEHGTELGQDLDQNRWVRHFTGRRRLPVSTLPTPLDSIWSRFRALPSGSLIRRSTFVETNGWDVNLCRPVQPFHAEDKDMAIQLALVGEVHRYPEPLFRYRILPTPHRASMYDGLAALNAKWWNAKLPRVKRRSVRRAIRFDTRVTVLDAFDQFIRSCRRGGPVAPIDAISEFAKAIARWVALPVRLSDTTRDVPKLVRRRGN